jgi:hypothetical protein
MSDSHVTDRRHPGWALAITDGFLLTEAPGAA